MSRAKYLIDKYGKNVSLIRAISATVIDEAGNPVSGTTSTSTIKMYVYPASGKDLKILPEGERLGSYFTGICYDEILGPNNNTGFSGDRITIGTKTFKVMNVKLYEANGGVSIQPFYQILLAEENS